MDDLNPDADVLNYSVSHIFQMT